MIIVFIACLPVGHYLAWRYNWLDRLERIFFANVRDHRRATSGMAGAEGEVSK
jgi:hypothetical protein